MRDSSSASSASRRNGGLCILTSLPRAFGATYVANLKSQIRFYTKSGWVVAGLLSPIFLLATAGVIATLVAPTGAPERFVALTGFPHYLSFVVLGLSLNGLAYSALEDGASAVYDEESQGTWDLVALTPVSRFAWMFGKTLAGMTASFIDLAIVLGAGIALFGLSVHVAQIPVAVLALALTVIALQGFAFLMAAVGLLWKEPHAMVVLLSPILVLVSGMMIPVAALPRAVQYVSFAFPLTHGLEAIRRALLLGDGLAALLPVFLRLLATGAALLVVGYAAFKLMERRALKAGALGRY